MADQVLTKQKLINADEDLGDLEEVLNGPPGKLIKTRLGREVYTLASVPQINTMTREEVNAVVAPKANKADVDEALSNLSTTANKYYSTLASANADIANIALNQSVTIGEEANSGLWEKKTAGATNLIKSPYDPLTQAKADATAKANNAVAESIEFSLSDIAAEKNGNLLDASMFTPGSLVVSGDVDTATTISYTQNYIPMNEFSKYALETSAGTSQWGGAAICFYDKNKALISGTILYDIPVGSQIVVPSGTYFMRTSCLNTNLPTFRISVTTTETTNAKTYAENLPKLTHEIISSNAKAKKLIGIIAGDLLSGGTVIAYTLALTDKDKFSFLFKCKPNTTYTICVKARSTANIREFKTLPESFASNSVAHAGQSISGTNVSATIAGINSRYHTFTTSAETNYIVYNPTAYTDIPFIVCEGEYSDLMWQSFMEQAQDKVLNVNTLNVETINTPMIQKGKNLVQGYQYGSSISNTQALYTELSSVTYLIGVSPLNTNWKNYVGVRIPLEVGKTYTISKEPSNKFTVAMLRANLTGGKIVLRDVGLQEYTFTAGVDDAYVYVQLSTAGETPRVQIEEGLKATDFESFGTKFNDPALPLGKKLTETSKQTDNTFISLGAQTDEFEQLHNSVNYDTIINKYYEPLRSEFPHLITREIMGKDSTGAYDVYAYTFEPDHYEQKIVISAGMHPTEIVTPFALGILLNEIYRNPEKHEGLAYLRNKVKITVLPVINVWGMNQSPRQSPEHYVNPNGVNPSRNFPERWDVNMVTGGIYDVKGSYPLSEVETQYMHTLMVREKQDCAFSLDLHTNQTSTSDTIVYWAEEDMFLRPVLEQVVSMKNDIVWQKYGREPINEAHETGNATKNAYSIRVLGVPSATIEYGTGSTITLSSQETTEYVDQLFNYVHYALKARLRDQIKQAEQNEHNKQYISLYNTLTAHNEVVGQSWTYAQWQTELYDKLGLTKSVIGAASGTYDLVKYVHAPAGYKNTIVLTAGKRGLDERKSVTELGFFAYKLMTDKNPHIVALRNNTRFIFLPVLNPHGHDNNSPHNANGVEPYLNFASSTQPESFALRSFIDSETIDLFVDISSLTNAYKPAGYADCQIIYNAKADTDYHAVFAVLQSKYQKVINTHVADYSTTLVKSQIADYINSKGIAYSNFFFAQNVLPKRTPGTGEYEDFGYEANEMAYCTEVLLNNIKEICVTRSLYKFLSSMS